VDAGADVIIAVNAVGALHRDLVPGSLALPDQLIDYTWGRASSFLDGTDEPLDHVEFAEPFDPDWRSRLMRAAEASGIALRDGGCIGVTQGPRLETAAEIRRMARDGCDFVGMTTMPEASLARERSAAYVTVAVIANYAAGVDPAPISMEAIRSTLGSSMASVRRLVSAVLEQQ
jgi:purine nucleoside phosphorylase